MDPKPKRKGRPLLVAAAGIAFVSYASCHEYKPVGNLRGPDNPPPTSEDASAPAEDASGAPVATPVEAGPAPLDAASPPMIPDAGAPKDAGAVKDASPTKDAGSPRDAGGISTHPVGNLRPPPPPPHPVGNLRAPDDE